jgi:hypothetical protein
LISYTPIGNSYESRHTIRDKVSCYFLLLVILILSIEFHFEKDLYYEAQLPVFDNLKAVDFVVTVKANVNQELSLTGQWFIDEGYLVDTVDGEVRKHTLSVSSNEDTTIQWGVIFQVFSFLHIWEFF